MAGLISVAWFMGSAVLEHLPNSDPAKLDALRGHLIAGLVIGGLLVLRVLTRWATEHPPEASTGMAWADRLAPWAHRALYALIFLMVGSGVAMALAFDLPAVVFSGQGSLPAGFSGSPARAVHGVVAKLLLLTVLAHVAAALYHQWVRGDRLLSRMGWGPRR
jgi:cytochrome b561